MVKQVKDLKENEKLSVTQIAKITGRGGSTIYKILKKYLNYKAANRLVNSEISTQSNMKPSSGALHKLLEEY